MNPDIQASITAGRDVTTVYVTAGDAGSPISYWAGRELGVKNAYAAMAGGGTWIDETVTLSQGGQTYTLASSYLAADPQIRLYFMRLPDGGGGNGFAATGNTSLDRLNTGAISQLDAIDGSNSYTRAELIGAFQALLEEHQPDQIRLQDHLSTFAAGEHSDHFNTSILTSEALADYSADRYTATSYVHYATSDLRPNLSAAQEAQTRATFLTYAENDPYVFTEEGGLIPLYEDWVLRQYIASEVTVAPASTTTVSGHYFSETTNQGIRGPGDDIVAGATVHLINAATSGVIATTSTDITGAYSFSALPPGGQYRISFQDPDTLGGAFSGHGFSTANRGSDAADSDVTNQTTDGQGQTDIFTIAAGQTLSHVDAGIFNANPASISGRYFSDADGNGLRQGSDQAVANANLHLLDASTGAIVATTTSDSTGRYDFANVTPGVAYVVAFQDPGSLGGTVSNHLYTAANQGSRESVDSDVIATLADGRGISQTILLGVGETLRFVDAGLAAPTGASISGRAFVDANANGTEDFSEAPVAGADVFLFVPNGQTQSTTTDANGDYSFANLAPASGYVVNVAPTADGFANFTFTATGQGADPRIDSDVSTSGQSAPLTLNAGQTLRHIDAGLLTPQAASVSGRYFVDAAGNGIDDGDAGLSDATVSLFQGTTEIAVTSTDRFGYYQFDDILFGNDYHIVFENPDFVSGIQGGTFTRSNAGLTGLAALDSDVTASQGFGNGATDAFSLAPGQDRIGVNAGVENLSLPWAEDGMILG